MTKAKISEYDAVAANNTDVNGVNIAEGCPPSGMNNMGREIMAALKRFQTGADGDSVTVGGSLVVSGTATTNTLTAGPVSATTLNTSGAVVFNDAGADVDFRVEGDTDANLLFVDASADKVGIGTNTPATLLDVSSSTTNTGRLRVTGTGSTTGNYRGYEFAGGSGFSGGLFQDEGTGALSIWSSPSGESIRIDASGNVGIGINAPTATLDVRGNANFLATDNATTRTILLGPSDFVSSTKYLAVQWSHTASAALYYTQGAFPHIFYTNNTERARITGGGSFYVGFTSGPTASGNFYSTGTAVIAAVDGSAASGDLLYLGYSDSTSTALGTLRFQVAANGNVTNSNGSYGTISDAKLKQDIVDASSQWNDIKALRIVKYRLKYEVDADQNCPAYIGVIAQEVEQVSPGLIDNCFDFENVEVPVLDEEGNPVLDEEGNPQVTTERQATGTVTKSVKSSIIYMKAVKALQEAMERIETLEAKVAALENA